MLAERPHETATVVHALCIIDAVHGNCSLSVHRRASPGSRSVAQRVIENRNQAGMPALTAL